MVGLDEFAREKLAIARGQSLLRQLQEVPSGIRNFCSNDYLGLSGDPRLKSASSEATVRYGTGAGASRLVTGNHPVYLGCEQQIAMIKETESALVFGSGYLANLGVIPALVGERDLVVADELSHACMLSGAKLSEAQVELFRHNDVNHAEAVLSAHRGRARNCLLMTEGVFSMDGDLAPLADLFALSRRFDAWLMTDDAHGLGVVGSGRGSAFAAGVKPDVQMGTLSKAVGAYGGYVACDEAVTSYLVNRARSFVYSTGLPPGVIAAASAGLSIISLQPETCDIPKRNASMFCKRVGLPEPASAIVPLIIGDSGRVLQAAEMLLETGYLVKAIRPPTVPDGTARLRFTFTALQQEDEILKLADIVLSRVLPAVR
jgi:8-amino-7-oxononanoate synthase